MDFDFNISRIYRREFSNPADVETFINSVQVIEKRISSATLRLRLHQCSENPLVIFEIWEYPDEDTMEWVRQSLEGLLQVLRPWRWPASRIRPKFAVRWI